ncbi:MAG: L-seryl-tRNA(Sec) selenium transferase, partial [candidate division Zixibacteria bacterium]|nr:L-seryl-tRNA(Sec) selenium transferase [candidate division Zixibacteria bacterium]
MDDFIIRTKRDIPSVEIISSERAIITLQQDIPRPLMVEIIRAQVESLKERMGKGLKNIRYEIFKKEIGSEIRSLRRRKIMQVINGTGILVHTNLGRAPLSDNLVEKFMSHLTGYNNLEYDISSGKRGKRGDVAEKYLAFLSRAEAGTIVNNNAAAIFLILNTLANKKKVIISRGELVQIG